MNTISARTARQFSTALAELYAADSEEKLNRTVSQAIHALFREYSEIERESWVALLSVHPPVAEVENSRRQRKSPLLVELLWLHVIRCRLRLAGRECAGLSEGIPGRIDSNRLTPREKQVLQRVALGETDAAAGRALGISTRTVSKHMEHILLKLGVKTRTAAVVRVHSSSAFPLKSLVPLRGTRGRD